MPTFEQKDYLCIVPFAWGRSGESARAAYKAAVANLPGKPYVESEAKAPFVLYRLSDAVDEVKVNDMGGFSYSPGKGCMKELCEARLVMKGFCNTKAKNIPEELIVEIAD